MRLVAVLLAVLLADVRPAEACATAPPEGEQVRIAEEEALIVWDPATKTEHFIRRAAFHSSARAFGFLVPTPSMPVLSEVPDSVFSILANEITPAVKYDRSETEYELGSMFAACLKLSGGGDKSAGEPTTAAVRVLATASVAGFDATTLEADDANALAQWLGNHGFAQTPQLAAWLDRYVKEKWKMTAFVVAGERSGEVATRAVKMTFPAERPFYPYREPQLDMTVESTAKLAPPVAERKLRVYFVSAERYAATHGDAPWSAKLWQAAPLSYVPPELETLVGAQRFLTAFVDDSSPRRGVEELYFARSPDQSIVKPPPTIIPSPKEVTIPVDLLVLLAAGLIWLAVRLRRRRA